MICSTCNGWIGDGEEHLCSDGSVFSLTAPVVDTFTEDMVEVAIKIAKGTGEVSVDQLRDYADSQGIRPARPASQWGAVGRAIAKHPHFHEKGTGPSTRRSNHGRQIKYWTWRKG